MLGISFRLSVTPDFSILIEPICDEQIADFLRFPPVSSQIKDGRNQISLMQFDSNVVLFKFLSPWEKSWKGEKKTPSIMSGSVCVTSLTEIVCQLKSSTCSSRSSCPFGFVLPSALLSIGTFFFLVLVWNVWRLTFYTKSHLLLWYNILR